MLYINRFFSRPCCAEGVRGEEPNASCCGLSPTLCCCAKLCGERAACCEEEKEEASCVAEPVSSCCRSPRSPPKFNYIGLKLKALPRPMPVRLWKGAGTGNCVASPPKVLTWPQQTDAGKALLRLWNKHPFLACESHYLFTQFEACVHAVQNDQEVDASAIIQRLEQGADMEERAFAAVFDLFKNPGLGILRHFEVHRMLKYLTLPSEPADVDDFMNKFDDKQLYQLCRTDLQAFIVYMGGSVRLFQKRKSALWAGEAESEKSIIARENSSLLGAGHDYSEVVGLDKELRIAGFRDSEVTYLRLMLPLSESRSVASLNSCQKTALQNIRMLARVNHEKALALLERRVVKLGFERDDLWNTLAWIRESAPIIIQLDLDSMTAPMNVDTHYRNQFETASSGGLLNVDTRRAWESKLFGGAYDGPDVAASDRVKYGVLNVMYDSRGVARTESYGDSFLILKDVRLRCTFSPEDSANLSPDKLAVADYFAHVLAEYTDDELKEVIKVATSTEPTVGNSCVVGFLKYKEAQIHGDIEFGKHVDRLVAHDRHNTGSSAVFLKEVCAKRGIKLGWLSDERQRMERERAQQLPSPERQGRTLGRESTANSIAGLRENSMLSNLSSYPLLREQLPSGFKSFAKSLSPSHLKRESSGLSNGTKQSRFMSESSDASNLRREGTSSSNATKPSRNLSKAFGETPPSPSLKRESSGLSNGSKQFRFVAKALPPEKPSETTNLSRQISAGQGEAQRPSEVSAKTPCKSESSHLNKQAL